MNMAMWFWLLFALSRWRLSGIKIWFSRITAGDENTWDLLPTLTRSMLESLAPSTGSLSLVSSFKLMWMWCTLNKWFQGQHLIIYSIDLLVFMAVVISSVHFSFTFYCTGNKMLLEYDQTWKALIEHYEQRKCIVDGSNFPPKFKKK